MHEILIADSALLAGRLLQLLTVGNATALRELKDVKNQNLIELWNISMPSPGPLVRSKSNTR